MGCCTSTANEILTVTNTNKQNKQQVQPIRQEMESQPIISIDKKIEVVSNQDEGNEAIIKQQDESPKPYKKPPPPPCKKPRPDNEEENFVQVEKLDQTPKKQSKLSLLIMYGRELKDSQYHNSQSDNQLIDQIEEKIFDGSITLQFIQNLITDNQQQLLNVLFLKGCQDITILEMILIYIDNYEIILELLQNYNLPQGDDLFYIARRLIRKLLPQRGKEQQWILALDFIKQIRDCTQVKNLIKNNYNGYLFKELHDFQSYFDLTNHLHVKLLGRISKLLKTIEITSTIQNIYQQAKTQIYFQNFTLPHKIPKGESDQIYEQLVLKELNFNIYHWLVLNNKWKILLEYSNPLFQQLDCSGMTPFLLMLKKAPLNIIINYLEKYPQQLQQSIVNQNQKMNILHALCMNKNLSLDNENELKTLIAIFSQQQISQILLQPYNDQIPLIIYLDCQKVVSNEFIQFLSQGLVKEFDFFSFNIKITQIAEKEKSANKKQKTFRNYNFRQYLKNQLKLAPKQMKYLKNNPITEEYIQEQILYLHYIQLMKQVIKRSFKIKFDWIKSFNIYTSYAPFDLGTSNQTFIQILLRNGYHEEAKQCILEMKEDLKLKQIDNQIIQIQGFSVLAQFLALLISLKKELRSNPYQQVIETIDSIVIEFIKSNPRLLIQQIFGRSEFKQIQYETIYSLLLQSKDDKLIDECLSTQLLFNIKNQTKTQILYAAHELKHLNSKDHLLKKILDDIPYKGIIKGCQQKFIEISIVNPKKADKDYSYINPQTLLNLRPIYCPFKDIIESLISIETETFELISFKVHRCASTIKSFLLHPESQKCLIELIETQSEFFSISMLWYLFSANLFQKITFESPEYFKFIIQRLYTHEYEKLYQIQLLGFIPKIISFQRDESRKLNDIEQVIEMQLQNKYKFWQALSLSKNCQQDLQSQLSIENVVKKIQLKQLLLIESFKNDTIQNQILICIKKDFTIQKLIEQLFFQIFDNKALDDKDYQSEHKIELFHKYLQIILQLQSKLKGELKGGDYLGKNFLPIIPYLSQNSWISLNNELKDYILNDSQIQVKAINYFLYRLDCEEEWLKAEEEIQQRWVKSQVFQDFLKRVIWIQSKKNIIDQDVFQFIIKQIKNYDINQYTQVKLQKLYYNLFKQQESYAINFLFDLNLTKNQILSLYTLSLKRVSINSLNKILHYFEIKNIDLDQQLLMTPLNCSSNILNYYRAMQYPYYLIFNTEQYKQFMIDVTITDQQKAKHMNQFILYGMYDKLKLIFSKGNDSFEMYSQFFFKSVHLYLEKQFSITIPSVDNNGDQDENNSDSKLYQIQFFSHLKQSQQTVQKQDTQIKSHQNDYQLKKIDQISSTTNSLKRVIDLQQVKKQKEKYQINLKNTQQHQSINPIFQQIEQQEIDHLKCFELIISSLKIDQLKKKQNLYPQFEFYRNLLNPDGKQVQKKQETLQTLYQIYQKNRFPNDFIKQRNKLYIQSANAIVNSKNFQLDFEVSIPSRMTTFQKSFFIELMLCNSIQTEEDISNQILFHNIQDSRCIKYLQTNLKEMNQLLFNSTTIYYSSNKVDLLKSTQIDCESIKGWNSKLQLIKQIMKLGEQFKIEQISQDQIYILKGRHDHIKQPIKYSLENLVISLIGNHFETIKFILKSTKGNTLYDLSLKVFKVLLIYQCEKNIISFFDEYIKGELKDIHLLFQINNVPAFYFLLFQRKDQVIQQIFIQQILKQLGSEQGTLEIKKQLSLPSVLTEYKVYQIALINKAYFLLEYLDQIIQLDDLQLVTTPLMIKLNSSQNNQIKINSLTEQFLNNYKLRIQECPQQIFWYLFEKLKKRKRITYNLRGFPLYKRDKIIDDFIKVEQGCLNQIFNLGLDQNFLNQQMDIIFAKYLWNKLSKFRLSNDNQNKIICLIEQQGINSEEFINFFKTQLQQQFVHPAILSYFERQQILIKIIDFIEPIHLTLELILFFYTSIEKEQFLSFAQKQFQWYKNNIINQEQYITEEEIDQDQEKQYMMDYVAYFLILLISFQNDDYQDQFLKYHPQAILIQKAISILSKSLKNQKNNGLSKKAQEYIAQSSKLPIKIDNFEEFTSKLNSQKFPEIALLQGLFFIQSFEWIVINIKQLLKSYNVKSKCFKIIIQQQEQDIELAGTDVIIYLQINNDIIIFDENKYERFKDLLEKDRQNKQFQDQVNLYQQFIGNETIDSHFDFSSIMKVNFEHLNFQDSFRKILDLQIPLKKFGLYEIDDFFAPHQNDQQQPIELTQELSLQRAPSLTKQSSSQTGQISTIRNQTINSRQRLKEDFQFMLELLPDNTYQVRQRRTNLVQREIVFPEFYNFQQPKIIVNIIKLDKQEFNKTYSNQNCLSINISDLYKYNEYLRQLIQGNIQKDPWIIDFPIYIQNQELKFKQSLFSTQFVQQVHQILLNFIEKVKIYAINENLSKLEWRINAISFLEVFVSKIFEIQNKEIDIYYTLNILSNWKSLIMILNSLIYKNLSDANQVLKVIKGIYIEFNESQDVSLQNCQVLDTNDEFDQLFIFGKTTYYLQNHILIIRINLTFNREKQIQIVKNNNVIIPNPQVQSYYNGVLNIYDFFTQIFSPEQLISLIFNKIEVDRSLLNVSNIISNSYGKTLTLSIDQYQLINIFTSEMHRAQQNIDLQKKLFCYEEIWSILSKLKLFFINDVKNNILNQLSTDKLIENFVIRLNSLLNSIKYNKNINQIIESNTREITELSGQLVIEQICNLKIDRPFLFGFQFQSKIYNNFCKLGDILGVCYFADAKIHFQLGQLIYNQKKGQFLFLNLNLQSNRILTNQQITRNQPNYQTIQQSNHDFTVCSIEDINTVILFQQQWPDDQIFNDFILNLFFIDSDGNLYQCLEKQFLAKMKQIQKEDSDNKQILLDELFGEKQVSAYGELTLTSMISIFQDVINYDFISPNCLKKQFSSTQNSIFVRIHDEQFSVDTLTFPHYCVANHFESNYKGQKQLQSISRFVKIHKELQNVYLIFDDELNHNARHNSQLIISRSQIFTEFQKGYENFMFDEKYPKLHNSMQQIFNLQSLKDIKYKIIQNLIKRVEFKYIKVYEDYQETNQYPLINFSNQQLELNSYVIENQIIEPESNQITEFLFMQLIQYKENQIDQFICQDNQFEIKWFDLPEQQYQRTFTDVILLSQILYNLINLIQPEKNFKTIQILKTKDIQENQSHNFYYQNQNNDIIFNYTKFQDFSLFDFVLNLLNNFNQTFQKFKDFSYIGPQILRQELTLNSNDLFQGLNNKESFEIFILMDNNQIQNLSVLNPKEFNQCFLFLKSQDKFLSVHLLKSYKHSILFSYDNQENASRLVGIEQGILINNLDSNLSIESQFAKIKIKLHQGSKGKVIQTLEKCLQERYQQTFEIDGKFITSNILLLQIKSDFKMKVELHSKLFQFSISNYVYSHNNQLYFEIKTVLQLSATKHIHIQYQDKKINIELEKEEHSTYGKGNQQLIKRLMKDIKKTEEHLLLQTNLEPITHSKELQQGNILNILSNQDIKAATRAGESRIDYIEFRDTNGNTVTEFNYQTIIFIHSIFNQIQYVPESVKFDEGLNLKWIPTFKGIYHLYIDNVKIQGRFIVIANIPNVDQSILEMQEKLEKVSFCEKVPFTFYLKDIYYNSFSEIESQIFDQAQCQIKLAKSKQQSSIKVMQDAITKFGQINFTVYFDPFDVRVLEDEIILEFLINNQTKKSIFLQISGLGLEKRQQKFQDEVKKVWKPRSYSLTVKRIAFLQDLLELVDEKMNFTFSIKFLNEPGIDAGGLKREFYDMIGNTLKDEKYKYFQPTQSNGSQYFLHPKFNKNKNKDKHAQLFGKLIANAICNQYLIGIDIIEPFWKVVFGEQIVFEDLKLVIDEDTYKNYENLTKLSPIELESACLDFTYFSHNSTVELIPNGQSKAVDQKCLNFYLNKTAEYVIHKQFAEIYKSFIEGFQCVLDINICKKWLNPKEMSLLTQGLAQITPNILLQKITYSGGKPQHKSFFETYVSQASPQYLKNMLKFITGSSSIPFDQSSYVISVQFTSQSTSKLPISHTCFKSIEVPQYNSFAELKQKLDIAFTIGVEGYGFG